MEKSLGAVVKGMQNFEEHLDVARWMTRVIDGCLYGIAALLPLFFLPFTVDILELGKQTLLIVLAVLGTLAWFARALAERRLEVSRSWLHLVVLVFYVGAFFAALFSVDRYVSFVGNFGQMQWSFATLSSFVLVYFLIANTVRDTTKIYHLVLAFIASSTLAGIIGLLQLLGVPVLSLFGGHARQTLFNTVGTPHALSVFMTVTLVLAASLLVLGCKNAVCVLGRQGKKSLGAKVLIWAAIVVTLLLAIIVDYWVVWAAILFGTALLVGISVLRSRRVERSTQIVVPAVLVAVSVIFLLFQSPLTAKVPAEVSPSMSASWNIARKTLQERPLIGSGPGTWIFNYAKHRSQAVNLSEFWTTRFERGSSTALTLLATIGLVGMALWVVLVISAIAKSAMHLLAERDDDAWQAYLTVFTGWAVVVFIAMFSNYNLAHHAAFWILTALLASLVTRGVLVWSFKDSVTRSSVMSLVFILWCVVSVSALWLTGQRLAAEATYAKAVAQYQRGEQIGVSIASLVSATTLNPLNDVFYRNLSQAHLIQASQEFAKTPDAEGVKRVNDAVTGAVNAARRATEVSPVNVDNYSNFASVLQAIAPFTRGADERAIGMYREALNREPSNPVFLNEIGRLHILRSDAHQSLKQSQDAAVRRDAELNIATELDKAAEALNQSIQLKPDYASAHYNLGLVYERQGRVPDAIVKLEQVLSAEPTNVGVAFQLSILYYHNNEKDKSLNMLEQLVAFDPSYANARWYLSVLYEERGRLDDAITQVELVKASNDGNSAVQERLNTLLQARDAQLRPPAQPLPEPVQEIISGPSESNEVQQ